jgi:putative membrane protein
MLVENIMRSMTTGSSPAFSSLNSKGVLIMWGCDYLPFAGGWGGGIFPGGLFSLLVLILIIAVSIYVVRSSSSRSRNSATPSQDRIDSMQILKARFANGDISQEEFSKMKQIVS